MKPRILDVTAMLLNKKPKAGFEFDTPQPCVKGKYFYIWNDDHIVKHRFLGYCVNKYAIHIATLKEDCWSK